MRLSIRHPKDFWSGLIFLALAIAFGWIAQGYSMGRAIKMGPGYFPTVLAGILALIGLITLVRSFVLEGKASANGPGAAARSCWGDAAVRPAAARRGPAVSVPVVVLVGAAAERRFKAPVAAPPRSP